MADRIPWLAKQGYVNTTTGLRHDAELAESERRRLVALQGTLNPNRVWTVERQVIVSTPGEEKRGGQRRFALRPFTVIAATAAEARLAGDQMKFEQEKGLGHHNG